MTTLKISLKDNDLNNLIDLNKLDKQVAFGIGQAALSIHASLKFAVIKEFKAPGNLDSVLIGKANSTTKIGKNIIQGKLEYKFKPVGLSNYFSPPAVLGNIPPLPKKREGYVHSVEIYRGRRKVVLGKEGHGGFIPRGTSGSIRFGKSGRTIMFEREGRSKYPLHVLFGPSLSQLVSIILDNNKDIQRALDESILQIEKSIDL